MSEPLAEVIRGAFVECVHLGSAVVATPEGAVVEGWGEPDRVVLPRSAAKPLQALALVESGAADAASLGEAELALACASHSGAALHAGLARRWLGRLGLTEAALACGGHEPADRAERDALIRAGAAPGRAHDNCSGKHSGFLTLALRLTAPVEGYCEPEHPVQRAVADAIHEATGDPPELGHAVDGCSAPNFATTLTGLARAMARMAAPEAGFGAGARAEAARRLMAAMTARPELVAGEGRATTGLMRRTAGRVAVKSGAEGVFVAMLPGRGLGVALKIDDGAGRAAECAMAAILSRLGEGEAAAPWREVPQRNRAGTVTGRLRPAAALA